MYCYWLGCLHRVTATIVYQMDQDSAEIESLNVFGRLGDDGCYTVLYLHREIILSSS